MGVTEISKDLARDIKTKIFKKFKTFTEAARHYSKKLGKSESHLRNLLARICVGKSRLYRYTHKNQECAISVRHLIKITDDLGIDKSRVEKNLISVRNFKSPLRVYNPRFPIKITPIASSLLFHYYCDGSHENWAQSIEKHPINRRRYFQKIEEFVGKISNWNSKRHGEIYTPVIIYQILEKLFGVNRFGFTHIKFPKEFLYLEKEILLGALVAIIIDEGGICEDRHCEIRVAQKNTESIEMFHKICQRLKYDVTLIKKEKNRKLYRFSITCKGVLKLYRDLMKLNKRYKNILDLGDKQRILDERVKIFNLRLKEENLKQPKGYSDNLNKNDVEILRYFRNPIGKREISKLTGNSLSALHHIKGKLKNMGFIKAVSWKNKEPLLKITPRGKKVLDTWHKEEEQKQKEFKEEVFRLYLDLRRYFKRVPTIKELCLNMGDLNMRRFYKIWRNKTEFEEELQSISFIKSTSLRDK